jgi:hypothetical protein
MPPGARWIRLENEAVGCKPEGRGGAVGLFGNIVWTAKDAKNAKGFWV